MKMDNSLKNLAEKTLRYLCVGSKVEGIKFYGNQILLSETDVNRHRIDGQVYLNIESRFQVFNSFPDHIPNHEDELPDLNWIEDAKRLCELRLKQITDISLGDGVPHLFITFESGEVLFVFGHHDRYESWQLGVLNNNTNKEEHWVVIAVPGDGIAIWNPDES